MKKLLSLLIIAIIIKQQCCQEDLPAINVMVVHRVSAKEGDIANLFCNFTAVNSVGDVDIKWYTRIFSSYYVIASASSNSPVVLESSSLIDRDRYAITDMATLEIDNVSRLDTGQYKCEVFDSSNSSIGDYGTVNLTVTYFDLPVSFEISPSEVEIGLNTKLSCEVTSYPLANITFWKGSEKMQVDSEKYYDAYEGMWITNIHIDDDGEYTCLADNGIEQHYADPITLTVQCLYSIKNITA
ncbi:peroxidasin homolog [Anneissia japonica]|uniref:peroxidasin homolog n=1 Tax=Anneissia japonica TaxID=1529436 RepID=UPI0014257AA4|nr:peroxidasin homolog [Anneissia japonica]XP_033096803.1 peroxidasin homolog [Anneissia japonica]XP_033096804.1 peroxidasin homolog [Anneissia japonica]